MPQSETNTANGLSSEGMIFSEDTDENYENEDYNDANEDYEDADEDYDDTKN